jgi:glycosyltransferase involved in cell wall biosynthesis
MGKWQNCMAHALTELGHDTTVWFADDFPKLRNSGRFSVLMFPIALALRLWREQDTFDVVVAHEPNGFWYALMRRVSPSLPPMIAMCHNVESKVFKELLTAASQGFAKVKIGNRIKTPLLRRWQSDGAIRNADRVVCLSSADRDYLINRLGCDPKRVTSQINGVGPEHFLTVKKTESFRKVLFVGGWVDVKGRRLLPKIWSRIRLRSPEARLTAIGTGLSAETVLADFKPQDRDSVTVIPRLTDPSDMSAQFENHDVLLVPSISEGSPLVVIEAMAGMLPVVAAHVGGIPDIITHESNGLLFSAMDLEDAATQVCKLIEDPALTMRIAKCAQERAHSLTWSAAATTLARVAASARESNS